MAVFPLTPVPKAQSVNQSLSDALPDIKPSVTWPLPSTANQSGGEGRPLNRHVHSSTDLRLLGEVQSWHKGCQPSVMQ
jgi:hypothetical protein